MMQIKEAAHHLRTIDTCKEGFDIVLSAVVLHSCINSSSQCVSLEGRLKVTQGLREQTDPGNPDLLFLLQQPGVDRDG